MVEKIIKDTISNLKYLINEINFYTQCVEPNTIKRFRGENNLKDIIKIKFKLKKIIKEIEEVTPKLQILEND